MRFLQGRPVPFLHNNIDTDQIYPARFLATTDFQGLHEKLFYDLRYPGGKYDANCPFNFQDEKAKILLAGENFGCGSSREHAAWALNDAHYRAVIAPSFGDIFNSNALQNGILTIKIPFRSVEKMAKEGISISIDLLDGIIFQGPEKYPFSADPFALECTRKNSDQLQYLLGQGHSISLFEENMNNHYFNPIS